MVANWRAFERLAATLARSAVCCSPRVAIARSRRSACPGSRVPASDDAGTRADDALQSLRHLAMEPRALGRAHLVVQRLANQRVREAVAVERVGHARHNPRAHRLAHRIESLGAASTDDSPEARKLEIAP